MAKIQTVKQSIPDFVRNGFQEEAAIKKFLAHLDRNKVKYQVIGTTIIIFLGFTGTALAASDTGIDTGAKMLYIKLLRVAKWVLIFKGGIDTVKAVAEGDHSAAKKNFLGYLLTFLLLLALPWAFDQIEKLFDEIEATGT